MNRNYGYIMKVLAFSLVCLFLLSGCSLFRSTLPDDTVHAGETDPVSDSVQTTDPATDTPEPPVTEKRVSVLAVGDNIIHEAVFADAKNRAADGREYDFLPMYAPLASKIAAVDIAFVNHETPLGGKEFGITGWPRFNSPKEAGEALAQVGFDVVNLATNHLFDRGNAAALATVKFVQTLPVVAIGAYESGADYESIRVTQVNGIRIAWVSFCAFSNQPYDPKNDSVIMPMLDNDATIVARIDAAEAVSDFVIVSAHWGLEQPDITAEQRRLAKVMAEAGADVIFGHHSHILQGLEWHENSDGSSTLIAYSLGNFLSTQHYAENMVGGMLTFDVVMENGACRLESPVMEITVTQYSMNRDSLAVYSLENYTDDLAKAHGTNLKNAFQFDLAWIYRHVRSIIAEEFLPPYFE